MSRIVAVTGAFGNLGAVVARRFVQGGWSVALIGHAAVPEPIAREFATQLLLPDVDVADLTAARGTVERIVARFGTLDALVNTAGGFAWEKLSEGDPATWDRMYRINVRTAVTMCKAALDALASAGGGRIVNIAAASATKAATGMGAYAAAKSGVMRLTEALADELKDRGVTVNAVLPSIIDTPQNRAAMPKADPAKWVAPAALADVLMFLCSPAARAIHGAAIPVVGLS
jgi:NAD(P)-dependent dehydrogenase (short-subunit alcohol dehydrogenase family)